MASAQALANTILKRAFNEKIDVTPMKLQKLIYFVYREWLKSTDGKLILEPFCAWPYGPVLSSVYDEFKPFGKKPINRFAKNSKNEVFVIDEDSYPALKEIINSVWELYKNRSGIELSNITHQEGGAWRVAYLSNKAYLSDDDIKKDNVR